MVQTRPQAIHAAIEFLGDDAGRRVASARCLADGEKPDLRIAVARYLGVLAETVDLMDASIVFASPEQVMTATVASRTVYASGIHDQVADVAGRLGVGVGVTAVVVMEHDLIGKIPSMPEPALREVVSSDFGAMVAGAVTLKGTGRVAEYLPWLVSIAGSVLCYGTGAGEDLVADRAVTKAFQGFAERGGPGVNLFSKLHLHHPDFLPALQAVADAAAKAVAGHDIAVPAPYPVICEVARRIVIDSLRSLGVGVERTRQTA